MTPKEKAKELVTKYASLTITTLGCGAENGNPCIITNVMFTESARRCALIAVDEILNNAGFVSPPFRDLYREYWSNVKQEIEKL